MTHLLFPGRHHLLTDFQLKELNFITQTHPLLLRDVHGNPLKNQDPIEDIIWAITSANHHNTRRNPLPANRREVAINEFGRELPVDSFVYHIDDIGTTDSFAGYVLKKVGVESGGKFDLTPQNTVIGCSTPDVIRIYEHLGFQVLPFELANFDQNIYRGVTPWKLLEHIAEVANNGGDWRKDPRFLKEVALASQNLFKKYDLGDLVAGLHRDPTLGEDGDLTKTRDYPTYVRAFDEGAKRKADLVKPYIKKGRIVDIGCCTGSVIAELTRDDRFRESDFYGIEIARQLFDECVHRKEQGHFANDNVFFFQRNVAQDRIFPPHSVDTFTTFSLTHEIESYQGRQTLEKFIDLLSQQTALGGRWINVDVVGPEHPTEEVYLWLNNANGRNEDIDKPFAPVKTPQERKNMKDYLEGLSTYGRFRRFAQDFRSGEGEHFPYEIIHHEGNTYAKVAMRDAAEFLSKFTYTDNWQSEMHERFCNLSFTGWKNLLESKGFRVHQDSHAFLNPWIVEHMYEGNAALYHMENGALKQILFPETNMLLIGERR